MPAAARRRAVSRPSPLLAPVIRAICCDVVVIVVSLQESSRVQSANRQRHE